MGTDRFEQHVVISGVGQSAIGRQVDRSGFQLTLDAVLAAIDDAGLTVDDIDGLAMFPGGESPICRGTRTETSTRCRTPSGITTTWRQGQVEGMSLPFSAPAQAVATGQARHAVIWRTVKEGARPAVPAGAPPTVRTSRWPRGPWPGWLPLGALSPGMPRGAVRHPLHARVRRDA